MIPPYDSDDFALARFNGWGSLDQSFGTGGKVHTDILGDSDYLEDIALQPDGKIVAVGSAYPWWGSGVDATIVRYNKNGSLDDGTDNDATPADSFGQRGRIIEGFVTVNSFTDVTVQPNGKILVIFPVENSAHLIWDTALQP